MGRADHSVAHDGEGINAWHNELPAWIKSDPAYQRLRQGPRHTLQMIANRCDAPSRDETGEIIGSAVLLVCMGGRSLRDACGCGSRTLWRHLGKLIELGYVVSLSYGTGRLANVYGIPGRRGELDRFRARPGERRGSGPGGRWAREDTKKLLRLLCQIDTLAGGDPTKAEAGQNGTAAATERHSSRDRMTRQPSRNGRLPSSSPSSCTSAHKPSPLRSRKARALLHDDDRGRPPDPNTDPLVDQLSITLPDGAGPDQVKAVLREHGVDAGRAHKLALHPLTTLAMVRDVIAKADGYRKANPGAYIGTMLDDVLAEARRQYVEDERLLFEAQQERLVETEASIDTMPDDELRDVIDSISTLRGLAPEAVRTDPAFRKEVARLLSHREEQENVA